MAKSCSKIGIVEDSDYFQPSDWRWKLILEERLKIILGTRQAEYLYSKLIDKHAKHIAKRPSD